MSEHVSKQLSLYIDNELSNEERSSVEAHLKACAQCRQELEDLQKTSSLLAQWQAPSAPDGFDDNVTAAILQHELKKEERPMELSLRRYAMPATAFVAVLALVFTMQTYVKRGIQGRMKSATDDIGQQYAARENVQYEPYYLTTNYLIAKNEPASQSVSTTQEFWGGDSNRDQIAQARKRDTGGFQQSTYSGSNLAGGFESSKLKAQTSAEYDSLHRPATLTEEPAATSSVIIVQPVLPAVGEGARVIRSAQVNLEVGSGQETYSKITQLTAELGGFLAQSNFYQSTNGVQAGTIVIRIPKDKFETALEKLRAFGKVEGITTNSQDVSREYADLESRMKTAMIVYDKMLKALEGRKVTIPDAIKLESELTPVTDRIESIKAQIEQLNNLTSFTSITVSFHESKVSPTVIAESIKQAKENLVIYMLGVLQFAVQSLPAMIGLIVIGTIFLAIVLRIKRKLSERKEQKKSKGTDLQE